MTSFGSALPWRTSEVAPTTSLVQGDPALPWAVFAQANELLYGG